MRGKTGRILLVTGAVALLAVAAYCVELAIPKRDYFVERAGTLVERRHSETTSGATTSEQVHLVSSSGLEVDLRVYRPAFDGRNKLPVLLVLGGYRTGKDAVDLVDEPDGVAYAAIDYPYHGKQALSSFTGSIAAIPGVQRAFLDSPAAVLMAMNWLLEQPWADRQRIELAGISLGVPFAAPAGALDDRFRRVWLMHGGGDNVAWVAGNLYEHVENDVLRRWVARLALFAVYGNSFDTPYWIDRIAPRPLIIVMARDDDFVPNEAQQPMLDAARNPNVELLWTQGRHIGPRREGELQQLLEIVRARMADAPLDASGEI